MNYYAVIRSSSSDLVHHGIKGMRWGVRRYQNEDGTRTTTGKRHRRQLRVEKRISEKEKHRVVMSRKSHYQRNLINVDLPGTLDDAINENWHQLVANAHQFTSEGKTDNVKYVDPTGKFEATYDKNGKLILDPHDMGTYNFSPSEMSKRKHFKDDVLPWMLYGNSPDDTSTIPQRVEAITGHYSKKTKRKINKRS